MYPTLPSTYRPVRGAPVVGPPIAGPPPSPYGYPPGYPASYGYPPAPSPYAYPPPGYPPVVHHGHLHHGHFPHAHGYPPVGVSPYAPALPPGTHLHQGPGGLYYHIPAQTAEPVTTTLPAGHIITSQADLEDMVRRAVAAAPPHTVTIQTAEGVVASSHSNGPTAVTTVGAGPTTPQYLSSGPTTQYVSTTPTTTQYVSSTPTTQYVSSTPTTQYVSSAPTTQRIVSGSAPVRYTTR